MTNVRFYGMPRWPGSPTPAGREIDPQNKSARPSVPMKHVVPALIAALLCASPCDRAQAQANGLKLQRSLGAPVPARGEDVPTFVAADRIEGLGGAEVEAIGDAELRRGDTRLTADRIKYFADTDEVEATGNVRLRVAGDEAVDVVAVRTRVAGRRRQLADALAFFPQEAAVDAPADDLRPIRGDAAGDAAGPTRQRAEIGDPVRVALRRNGNHQEEERQQALDLHRKLRAGVLALEASQAHTPLFHAPAMTRPELTRA